MANTLAALLRCSSLGVNKNLISSLKYAKILQPQVIRHLYSKSSLGMESYMQQRERTKVQLSTILEKFKAKMAEYSADESKSMIFTEDLKNMIHIAENNQEIDIVIKMMKRFNQQNEQLRFGNFIFGPVVMRLFHLLNKPEEALQCFKAPELQGFFDQLMSYQLLLDLLYENEMYNDILETFHLIKEKQISGSKYPRNIVVLTLAACYKLNSPESVKYALDLWSELISAGHIPMRRAVTFCAGLVLNQGKPESALEILSASKNQSYTTVRNIKVAALVDMGRLEDAVSVLKIILSQDTPDNMKQTFNKDVIERVKQAVEQSDNVDIKTEFSRLEKYFQEQEHISDKTLSEQLCLEIVGSLTPLQSKKHYPKYNNYNSNEDRRTSRNYSSRPGLSELQ